MLRLNLEKHINFIKKLTLFVWVRQYRTCTIRLSNRDKFLLKDILYKSTVLGIRTNLANARPDGVLLIPGLLYSVNITSGRKRLTCLRWTMWRALAVRNQRQGCGRGPWKGSLRKSTSRRRGDSWTCWTHSVGTRHRWLDHTNTELIILLIHATIHPVKIIPGGMTIKNHSTVQHTGMNYETEGTILSKTVKEKDLGVSMNARGRS